jgi:uncharacterized protein YuzE
VHMELELNDCKLLDLSEARKNGFEIWSGR